MACASVVYVCAHIWLGSTVTLPFPMMVCLYWHSWKNSSAPLLSGCSRNAKSQLDAVIEHLVGRQGQPREAQVHAMYLNDQKGWILAPPLPRPHLNVGSGGEGILLEIPAYRRPSKGKLFFSLFLCPQLLHLCFLFAAT